jgi:hypothetical protein
MSLERIITRRQQHMMKQFSGTSLKSFFGIEDMENSNIHFELSLFNPRGNSYFQTFRVVYSVNYKFHFNNIPVEINDIISSYNSTTLILNFEILYDEEYPFSRPVWRFIQTGGSFTPKTNLQEYYEYMANMHNNIYEIYWSPAIHPEKDVLSFIQKINHFEHMIC